MAAAWEAAIHTGNLNALVYAYRGSPCLIRDLLVVAERDQLTTLLRAANDTQLARRFGIKANEPVASTAGELTRREVEVINMVASGLSNKEIAGTLYIAEATVKAHLRHTYEKLGVRGRSEAIARWLTPQ
jgi:ATP/maltotriose-dependent transcriptional regulator MalT